MNTYIDTKEGDAVSMVPAISNVSHFLDCATVGENVPLQIQILKGKGSISALQFHVYRSLGKSEPKS
jgi:hypothetical protein